MTGTESKTQMVPLKTKVDNVRALLHEMRGEIARALPKHITVDKLTRVALTSIVRTPKLLECSRVSLANAILQAAQLGLEPDGVLGYAYLVPYGATATLIPGYKGLMDLARRSGRIESIEARVVHAKDTFKFAYGLRPVLEHKPYQGEDAGDMVATYAIAHLRDGGVQWDVMWKREIDGIRKRSKSGHEGPWVSDYEEMSKKTVVRRLCKMLPASVELQRAVALDERAELGLALDEVPVPEVAPATAVEAGAPHGGAPHPRAAAERRPPEEEDPESHTFPPTAA